jgi:BirA family transcriptional regulator, biotin operon repressor / biotin---[acetyl-CoA-carboxylase] ligase
MLKAGPYEDVARALVGTPFATIEYVEETESTNADAAALLGDERAGGRTIVAEYQSRGAGRKGRTWLAPAGSALLFTTILPRSLATDTLWVVPYWVALAVRTALLDFGVTTTLQWPNDLLLGTAKLAGILCQSSVSGARARVACGVGINVRRPGVELGIEPPPAFCDDVVAVERGALLHGILRQYQRSLFLLDQPERVIADWDEAAELPGKRYRIQLDGDAAPFDGVAQGLVPGGGLRVLRGNGVFETVSLADARVLR